MMQVVCCQLAVRLETGTLGLATERTSDGAWVESSVSSACLVRCVALELRGEVLAFLFIMYKPDPLVRSAGDYGSSYYMRVVSFKNNSCDDTV